MFIQMNTIYFLAVLAVLLIAFAFSMGHEIWRNKLELQKSVNEGAVSMADSLYAKLQDALKWKHAVQDSLLLLHTSWSADEQDAQRDLSLLIETEISMALDPAISQGALRLVNKAKREHGKKIRAQADRKLARSERDYEERLRHNQQHITDLANRIFEEEKYKRLARAELSQFQGALMDVLEAKVKLPTVRQSLLDELNRRHVEIQLNLKG